MKLKSSYLMSRQFQTDNVDLFLRKLFEKKLLDYCSCYNQPSLNLFWRIFLVTNFLACFLLFIIGNSKNMFTMSESIIDGKMETHYFTFSVKYLSLWVYLWCKVFTLPSWICNSFAKYFVSKVYVQNISVPELWLKV